MVARMREGSIKWPLPIDIGYPDEIDSAFPASSFDPIWALSRSILSRKLELDVLKAPKFIHAALRYHSPKLDQLWHAASVARKRFGNDGKSWRVLRRLGQSEAPEFRCRKIFNRTSDLPNILSSVAPCFRSCAGRRKPPVIPRLPLTA